MRRLGGLVDRYDLIFVVGLVLVSVGLVWVWWPLALIVPGVVLVLVGLAGAIFGSSASSERAARG